MADELGSRIRYDAVVTAVDLTASRPRVTVTTGETVDAEAVVSALPVGPLRNVELRGVDDERLRSLRAQRHAPAAKLVVAYDRDVWVDGGASGLAHGDVAICSTWPQGDRGILSSLVPPERLDRVAGATDNDRDELFRDMLVRLFGPVAASWQQTWYRGWGHDPFTLGYITAWRPGDVTAVGQRHGTHAPPFYVCGSDQWVAGYMEGAVRTGRGAAGAALGSASAATVEG